MALGASIENESIHIRWSAADMDTLVIVCGRRCLQQFLEPAHAL